MQKVECKMRVLTIEDMHISEAPVRCYKVVQNSLTESGLPQLC